MTCEAQFRIRGTHPFQNFFLLVLLFSVPSLCVLDSKIPSLFEIKINFFSSSQSKRLGSLNKFKAKARSILLATDVASRGLDIPHVDVVVNFDIPTHSKVSPVGDLTF